MSLSVSTFFWHSISSPKDSILGMNYVMPGEAELSTECLIFSRLSHVHMVQLKGVLPIHLTRARFLIIEPHFSPRQLKLFRLLKASLVESLLAL